MVPRSLVIDGGPIASLSSAACRTPRDVETTIAGEGEAARSATNFCEPDAERSLRDPRARLPKLGRSVAGPTATASFSA